MKGSGQSRSVFFLMVFVPLVGLVTSLVQMRGDQATALGGATILTGEQMRAIFGDEPVAPPSLPCVKIYPCNQGFTSGATNCAKCTGDTWISMCCPLGANDDCTYNGQAVCDGTVKWVGPLLGDAGTCATCTSNAFVQTGTCQNITSATGTLCRDVRRPTVFAILAGLIR